MKTGTRNKTGNRNTAQAALADINAKIVELQQQRIGLAQPLKDRYAELRGELAETEKQIRDLDPTWKPAPLKPKAQDKIREIIVANGRPMTETEIFAAVGDLFTKYKVRQTLKKRFTVDPAGKYSAKP
jgi:uncharacterized protein YukE